MKSIFRFAFAFCFAATSAAAAPLDEAFVLKLLAEQKVPGVSIAVIKNFQIAWAKGYGIADAETRAPVTVETLFQAASMSKPVAAMASMKAVQNGAFTLDQDINTILKSWKLPAGEFGPHAAVTPRGLMSHTSGMGDAFGFPGYGVKDPLPTLVQILDGEMPSNLGRVRLERPPMTAFEYSGGAVMIQQLVLTDATKRPFDQLMKEWVLGPIGMTNSTFEQPLPPAREAKASRAHGRGGARMGDPWHVYPEHAAAGLWTTPSDMAKFLIEVQKAVAGQSTRVLTQAAAREMITPVGVGPYAVGFMVRKDGEGWYFQHGGGNWGFNCDMKAHVSRGYGVVIMTNSDRAGTLIAELGKRIQWDEGWDVHDIAVQRAYGP